LSGEAQDFFAAVTAGLDAAGVAWTRNAKLVRGLDYYRHTAFEFTTDRLGAQGTVLGGGRYDGLIENLGGPPTPAVGWAAGIERLAMLVEMPKVASLGPAVILSGQEAASAAVGIVATLRREKINAELIYKGSVNKLFDKLKSKGHPIILTVAHKDQTVFIALRRLSHTPDFVELEEQLIRIIQSKLNGYDAAADDHGIRPNYRIDINQK
jgi:histidyl-tRNA synthetase